QLAQPGRGALAQFVQRPELDRLGRAGLRAGRRHARPQPVVAQRALPRPAVALALVDHPVRAGRDAVPAAVADVLLHHDRAELRAEQRTRRADVQAGGMGAVLADVGGHQPAKPVPGLAVLGLAVLGLAVLGLAVLGLAVLGLAVLAGRRRDRPALLDERHVPPGVGAEADRVVVRHPGQYQAVVGNAVPLLAGHLARLAADAHRCVGEETHPRRRIVIAAGGGL